MILVLISKSCLYYEVHEKNWPQRPAEHGAGLMNIWLHGAFGGIIAVFKVSSILLLKIAANQAAVQGSLSLYWKNRKERKEKNQRALVPMTFVWVFASVGAPQRGWRRGGKEEYGTSCEPGHALSSSPALYFLKLPILLLGRIRSHARSFIWMTNTSQKQHLHFTVRR